MLVGICSDDKNEIQQLSRMIIRHTGFMCDDRMKFYIPQEALYDVEEGCFDCDVLFIKAECIVDGYNGIMIAKMVNENNPRCQIVFFSNTYDHIPEIYDVNHCFFTLYDQLENHIDKAFRKVEELISRNGDTVIEMVSNRIKVYVHTKDISVVYRDGRQTVTKTDNKDFITYKSLLEFEKALSEDFVRCHTGFIVNLNYVEGIKKNLVILKDASVVPIGRSYEKRFRDKYKQFVHRSKSISNKKENDGEDTTC
ncbi:MAG: LytR/AlgR family response regulator transcription factor [Lachnospiraceae bacterium]